MKCRQCQEGRRFAKGSVSCPLYGFIIREDHEGTREGCAKNEARIADGGGHDDNQATELQDDEWAAVDGLPGFLQDA